MMNAKKTQLILDCDFDDYADQGDYSDYGEYDDEYGNDNPQDDEIAKEKQAKKQREKEIKSKLTLHFLITIIHRGKRRSRNPNRRD